MTTTRRLPKPVAETWQWQMHAACRDLSTSRFFHPDNERGNAREKREQRAKEICQRCPVMWECRAHALRADEPYGVWGGLGERERWELISQRRGHRRFDEQKAG
jgi:WhiB family redox-sensing transcriptional regulator